MRVSHQYFPAFDVFRGIGILFVVLAHTPGTGPIRPLGALGVHMFFALSGFLITYRFLEEREQTGRIDLAAFYRRRARRILPPAILYLAVLAVLGSGLHWLPVEWREIAASLFFYRNIIQAGWYTGHFWSLSLEEQFYLFWPVLLVGLGLGRARWAALGIIAGTVGWRAHVFSVDPGANIYRPDLLADHLLWGCVIGMYWKRVLLVDARLRAGVGVLGIAAAAALIYLQPPFWQPVFAFSVAVGFILSAEASQGWASGWKAFQKLGEASYDCYIWQSLFLPLPFAGAALPMAQRLPWNYLLIAGMTAGSYWLTFPRRPIANRTQAVSLPHNGRRKGGC